MKMRIAGIFPFMKILLARKMEDVLLGRGGSTPGNCNASAARGPSAMLRRTAGAERRGRSIASAPATRCCRRPTERSVRAPARQHGQIDRDAGQLSMRDDRGGGSRPAAPPARGSLIEADAVVQRVPPDRRVVAVGWREAPRTGSIGPSGSDRSSDRSSAGSRWR